MEQQYSESGDPRLGKTRILSSVDFPRVPVENLPAAPLASSSRGLIPEAPLVSSPAQLDIDLQQSPVGNPSAVRHILGSVDFPRVPLGNLHTAPLASSSPSIFVPDTPLVSSPGPLDIELQHDYFSQSSPSSIPPSHARGDGNVEPQLSGDQIDLFVNLLSSQPSADFRSGNVGYGLSSGISLTNREGSISIKSWHGSAHLLTKPTTKSASLSTATAFQLLSPPTVPKKVADKIVITAISPTGMTAALLSHNKFWVFDTTQINPSLSCHGVFSRGGKAFEFGNNKRDLALQYPVTRSQIRRFSVAGMNDRYLAIGTCGGIMVFITQGEHAGRWLVYQRTQWDPQALIEKLVFSPDGKYLLALARGEVSGHPRVMALIFSTDSFPQQGFDRSEPIDPKPYELIFNKEWDLFSPMAVAFSSQGTMIAIATAHSGHCAGIQLLEQLESGRWQSTGRIQWVDVFQKNLDERDWTKRDYEGKGVTGISLYFLLILVLTAVSKMIVVLHCHWILPSRKRWIYTASGVTMNEGFAPSH